MIKTVKETIASVKDINYGRVIITKTKKQVLWYWTKYMILVSVIPLIIGIFAFTRYLPESPKFILDKFPAGTLTVKSNQLTTTLKEPYTVGNQDFVLIIDTEGDVKELAAFTSGAIFLKDKVVVKSQDNQLETQNYSKIPDFSVDKNQLSAWVSHNLFNLWLGGVGVILLLGVVTSALSWLFRLMIYGLWSLAFWILARYLLKKSLTYIQTLSVILYASVIQLVLSLFLTVAPNQLLEALGIVLFVYFSFTWIRNSGPDPVPAIPPPLPRKTRRRKK